MKTLHLSIKGLSKAPKPRVSRVKWIDIMNAAGLIVMLEAANKGVKGLWWIFATVIFSRFETNLDI